MEGCIIPSDSGMPTHIAYAQGSRVNRQRSHSQARKLVSQQRKPTPSPGVIRRARHPARPAPSRDSSGGRRSCAIGPHPPMDKHASAAGNAFLNALHRVIVARAFYQSNISFTNSVRGDRYFVHATSHILTLKRLTRFIHDLSACTAVRHTRITSPTISRQNK